MTRPDIFCHSQSLEEIIFSDCHVDYNWMKTTKPMWSRLKRLRFSHVDVVGDGDLEYLSSYQDIATSLRYIIIIIIETSLKARTVTCGRVRPEGECADVAMRAGLDLLILSHTLYTSCFLPTCTSNILQYYPQLLYTGLCFFFVHRALELSCDDQQVTQSPHSYTRRLPWLN